MKLIGMIVPDGANQYFSTLAQQFQRDLARNNYALVVLNSDSTQAIELNHIDMLSSMNVNGIIFISVGDSRDAFLKLKEIEIPLLILDREVPLDNADFLLIDNNRAVEYVVNHLCSKNFKRIGIIQGDQKTEPGRIRYNQFIEYTKEKGCELLDHLIFKGDFLFSSGTAAADKVLEMSKDERPDAIFASNDLMAMGFIQRLQENDIKIPSDISVIGFDDIKMASWIYPRLTTIKQDLGELSDLGVKLLLDRINSNPDSAKGSHLRSITPNLIIRDSCK